MVACEAVKPRLVRSNAFRDDRVVHNMPYLSPASLGRMSQPGHRVRADAAIALRNIRPGSVIISQPEKNALGALVCAQGKHDFVTFAEFRNNALCTYHFTPSFSIAACMAGASQ